jgi:predicted amidophosphoribosyltransferase
MARQYIEPMLAPRRSNTVAATAAVLAMRLPSLCADCRATFASPLPRCRRCALAIPADVDVCGECLRSGSWRARRARAASAG